jgi:hypothetical protein
VAGAAVALLVGAGAAFGARVVPSRAVLIAVLAGLCVALAIQVSGARDAGWPGPPDPPAGRGFHQVSLLIVALGRSADNAWGQRRLRPRLAELAAGARARDARLPHGGTPGLPRDRWVDAMLERPGAPPLPAAELSAGILALAGHIDPSATTATWSAGPAPGSRGTPSAAGSGKGRA